MNERERWIVYPLLVLALGASLRDKFSGSSTLEADQIRCNEIRASQLVIADPQAGQPRIVLRTVPEPTISGTAPGTAGQIELLDHAQRPQTVIQHGVVHSPGLRSQAIAVIDPAGKPRVHIGVKPEGEPPAKGTVPLTSGFVEVFGKGDVPLPAVRLATSPEGGFLFARREGLSLGVAVGNFAPGSGTYLQVGDRLVPLAGSLLAGDIKKLEKMSQDAAVKKIDGNKDRTSEQGPNTAPAVQPTGKPDASER